MQSPSSADEDRLVFRGGRRNGFDRIAVAGVLDHSSVLLLEGELSGIMRTAGALILDLRELTSIDRWGIHALDLAAQRADRCGSRIFIVSQGSVLAALEAAGTGHLLSEADAFDLFESDDRTWTSVALPPLPEQRAGERPRVAREAS